MILSAISRHFIITREMINDTGTGGVPVPVELPGYIDLRYGTLS